MVNIAVLGYGTVGSGVVEVVDTNGSQINQRIGEELNMFLILKIFLGILYRRKLFMISKRSSMMMMFRSL